MSKSRTDWLSPHANVPKEVRPLLSDQKGTVMPNALVTCGKLLSTSARAIYLVIAYRNPSYAGLKKMAFESGLSRDTVLYAIYELVTKHIIEYVRGRPPKVTNLYRLLPESEWTLLEMPLSRKEWNLGRKRRPKNGSCGKTSSGLVARPHSGLVARPELDQSQLDQNLTSPLVALARSGNDATHQRSPSDRLEVLDQEIKGVRPSAEPIWMFYEDPNAQAQIAAQEENWEQLVEGENLQVTC